MWKLFVPLLIPAWPMYCQIVVIQGTDPISSSRVTINSNFSYLDSNKVPITRTITAGTGITGGGSLSADRTISLAFPSASTIGGVMSKLCSGTDKISSIGTDGIPICTADSGGGGGAPGGSNGQIQYNNAGAFGGLASTGTGDVVRAGTPSLTTPSIASFINAGHNHVDSAGGSKLGVAAVSATGTPSATTYWRGDNTWSTPSGSGSPTDATYITQTPDASLSAEQALSVLSTGFLKVTTSTGVITSQASMTDADVPDTITVTNYQPIDADLTAVGNAVCFDGQILKKVSGVWTCSSDSTTGYTTSADLATALNDETGTGLVVLSTSPTIVTPTIASFANAGHTHTNAAGGSQLGVASVSATGTPSAATFWRGDNTWSTPAGSGDVTSITSVSVDGEMVLFSGATGKSVKRSTLTGGVLKTTAGIPALVTGTASDCVKVDGSSGACGGASLTTGPSGSLIITSNVIELVPAAANAYQDAGRAGTSAVGTDAYAITLSGVTSYATNARYTLIADVANTGAATLNVSGLGAKNIVKFQGGVNAALADNDIRVGQRVDLIYDGTSMQMQSTLGNGGGAAASSPLLSTALLHDDDFCAGNVSNGTIGLTGFLTSASNTNFTLSQTSEANHPCVISATTTTPGTNVQYLYSQGAMVSAMNTATNFTMISTFKTPASLTNVGGFFTGLSNAGSIINGSTIGAIYTGSGVLKLRVCDSGTCGTDTSSATTVASSTWYTVLTTITTAGTVRMTVNGGAEVTKATNLPSAAMVFQPLHVTNVTSFGDTFLLDRFGISYTGLAR